MAGHHARELINPDALVGLAYKLCWAYKNNIGITLGSTQWSADYIRTLVEGLDIFILPLLNPDGREYVRLYDQWWRKNRGFNADGSRGTDLNRNYDFLWQWSIGMTSSVPSSETYRGSAPFSEPETRNVRWLLDTYPNITGFVDVHSYSELVLYPWGDDNNQSADPTENFLNPAWDGMRGTGGGYAEYISAADQTRFTNMANAVQRPWPRFAGGRTRRSKGLASTEPPGRRLTTPIAASSVAVGRARYGLWILNPTAGIAARRTGSSRRPTTPTYSR